MCAEKFQTKTLSLRQQVYQKLRKSIISGRILPGESITLRSLSSLFQVSVIPVREALFQLEAENIVIRRDNKDYRVNFLSEKEFHEIYSIRRSLEIMVARKAVRTKSNEGITKLEKIFTKFKAASSNNNKEEYINFNHLFHFTIYSYSEMQVAINIINSLWSRVGPYLALHIESLDNLSHATEIHEGIFNSFKDSNEAKMISSLRKDLNYSFKNLLPIIKKFEMTDNINFREFMLKKLLL